jgi:hypothetical protein
MLAAAVPVVVALVEVAEVEEDVGVLVGVVVALVEVAEVEEDGGDVGVLVGVTVTPPLFGGYDMPEDGQVPEIGVFI